MTLDEVADKIFEVLTIYKDGGLLIEDVTKFIGDHYPKDIIGAICTQRHRSVDIIIHFQTVGKLTNPKIWGNLNWIRLHKTTDRFERYKDKFAEYIEMLKISQTLVDTEYNNGNERFYSWIDLNSHDVKGQFNSTQFVNAIDEYISMNHNRVMRDLLNKRDNRGKKLYKPETAAMEKRQQLYDDYYGNDH